MWYAVIDATDFTTSYSAMFSSAGRDQARAVLRTDSGSGTFYVIGSASAQPNTPTTVHAERPYVMRVAVATGVIDAHFTRNIDNVILPSYYTAVHDVNYPGNNRVFVAGYALDDASPHFPVPFIDVFNTDTMITHSSYASITASSYPQGASFLHFAAPPFAAHTVLTSSTAPFLIVGSHNSALAVFKVQ